MHDKKNACEALGWNHTTLPSTLEYLRWLHRDVNEQFSTAPSWNIRNRDAWDKKTESWLGLIQSLFGLGEGLVPYEIREICSVEPHAFSDYKQKSQRHLHVERVAD